MKKFFLLFSFTFALLLFVNGCGGSDTPTAQSGSGVDASSGGDAGTAAPSPAVSAGVAPAAGSAENGKKVLNFAVFSPIATLEPTTDWDGWYVVRVGVGETLVKFDASMAAEPWLAESWSVGDDKLTWTFKIRDGVKFSNGKPLTAKEVKESLERVWRLNEKRFRSEFFSYDSISADGMNLSIKTKDPTPGLPGMLADPLFLVVDVSADNGDTATEGPVCTGPYKFLPRTGDTITAVRNDFFRKGRPKLDEVNFITVADPNTRALALQSGDIDMAANMSTVDVPLFIGNPDFEVEEIESLRLVMAFMNPKGALGDENLRKAVKSALDLKTYAEKILSGRFTPGKGPLPPSLGYGFDALVDPYSHDPEKAKTFLAEGGWTDSDGDGFVDKDGVTPDLDYVYYSGRAEFPLLVEATQNALSDLGIKVTLNLQEYGNFVTSRTNKDFDFLVMNIITAGTGDPQSFLVSQFETGAFGNSNSYSNEALDALFRKLKVEFDPVERTRLVTEAQKLLVDPPFHIFYCYPNTNMVHNKRITGVRMYPADYYWVTEDVDIVT
ncbi:MAG: ABC transporter substrate-binding protein [Deltaproteobacteria bacterium]|jgi:peptide/nickel transport system substrate-binding protein|nr:ABC transporter substrate-binding protein [Deltaproteobacteria bacterium]